MQTKAKLRTRFLCIEGQCPGTEGTLVPRASSAALLQQCFRLAHWTVICIQRAQLGAGAHGGQQAIARKRLAHVAVVTGQFPQASSMRQRIHYKAQTGSPR